MNKMIIRRLYFYISASKILAADSVYNFDVKNEVNIAEKHYTGFFNRKSSWKSNKNISINHFVSNKAHQSDS